MSLVPINFRRIFDDVADTDSAEPQVEKCFVIKEFQNNEDNHEDIYKLQISFCGKVNAFSAIHETSFNNNLFVSLN